MAAQHHSGQAMHADQICVCEAEQLEVVGDLYQSSRSMPMCMMKTLQNMCVMETCGNMHKYGVSQYKLPSGNHASATEVLQENSLI